MKKFKNLFSYRNDFSFLSIGILLLLSVVILSFENADRNISYDASEAVLTGCTPLPPVIADVCPGTSYDFTYDTGGCTNFTMLRSCSGYNISASYPTSSSITLHVEVAQSASSNCVFRYSMTDSAGNICTRKTGLLLLPANSPLCCPNPPCP